MLTTLNEWRLSIFGTQMFMLYMPDRHQTRAVRTCIDYLLGRALPAEGAVSPLPGSAPAPDAAV